MDAARAPEPKSLSGRLNWGRRETMLQELEYELEDEWLREVDRLGSRLFKIEQKENTHVKS